MSIVIGVFGVAVAVLVVLAAVWRMDREFDRRRRGEDDDQPPPPIIDVI